MAAAGIAIRMNTEVSPRLPTPSAVQPNIERASIDRKTSKLVQACYIICMPRRPRFSSGGHIFHVLNRATARSPIFSIDSDYAAFERVLQAAGKRVPVRLLAYCLMPNHWHLVIWPRGDKDLSNYMHWLSVTHTQRWHLAHGTAGTGPVYQGRFKSFPVESDTHFFQVCRYVERNALRAKLVSRAELWRWSSLWQHTQEQCDVELHTWPLPRPSEWLEYVNRAETEAELLSLRQAACFGRPFGSARWQREIAVRTRTAQG
jgi:putative transposase